MAPTPYQAFEDRVRHLKDEKSESQQRLEEISEARRTTLRTQKASKLATSATNASDEETQLAEKQKTKIDQLKARQSNELQQIKLQHARELVHLEEEGELARNALAKKKFVDIEMLEKAFQAEESAIEAHLEGNLRELKDSYDAKIEEVKNEVFETLCSRVHAAESDNTKSLRKSPPKSPRNPQPERQQPLHQSTSPAIMDNKSTGAPLTIIGIRPTAEREKCEDATTPRGGPKNGHATLRSESSTEVTTSKRVKIASSAIDLDPAKFFQVVCLRHYKYSERKYASSTDLWEGPEKKLYLHMGIEMLRPVAMHSGSSHTVNAANWYLEVADVDQVQYSRPHCLVRFRMESFALWIRFKEINVLDRFLVAVKNWGTPFAIQPTIFSSEYDIFPTDLLEKSLSADP